jgi:hypothetical protein
MSRLWAGWSRFWIQARAKDFSLLPKDPDWLWVQPSLLFSGYQVHFLSGAEVKNKWNCRCTSAPWGAWHEQRQLYLFLHYASSILGGTNKLFKRFEVIYTGRCAPVTDPHGKMRTRISGEGLMYQECNGTFYNKSGRQWWQWKMLWRLLTVVCI